MILSENRLVIILKSSSFSESAQLIVLSLNRQLEPRCSLLLFCVVSAYSLQTVQKYALLSPLGPQNKFSMILRKIGTCVLNTKIHAS